MDTLYESLDSYYCKHTIDEECGACGSKLKLFVLSQTLPPILIINLARFGPDGAMDADDCAYPPELDMLKYLKPPDLDPRKQRPDLLYRLIGVIYHTATESIDTGHYGSYVLREIPKTREEQEAVPPLVDEEETAYIKDEASAMKKT